MFLIREPRGRNVPGGTPATTRGTRALPATHRHARWALCYAEMVGCDAGRAGGYAEGIANVCANLKF